MALYMAQLSYTSEALATLVQSPQNRAETARSLLGALNGTLIGWWLSFGEYDVVTIYELPGNVAAAALAIAVAAGGAVKAVKTTPLLTGEEMVEALREVPQAGYRPPQ